MTGEVKNRMSCLLDVSLEEDFEEHVSTTDIDRCLSGIYIDDTSLRVILEALPKEGEEFAFLANYLRISLLAIALEGNEDRFKETDIWSNKIIPFVDGYVQALDSYAEASYIAVVFDMARLFEQYSRVYSWKQRAMNWAVESMLCGGSGEMPCKNATKYLRQLIKNDRKSAANLLLPNLIKAIERSSTRFHDWASSLVLPLSNELTKQMMDEIIAMGLKREMMSLDYCNLMAHIMMLRDVDERIALFSDEKSWANPDVRLTVMKRLVERGTKELVYNLLQDPCSNLDHFVVCFRFISPQEQKRYSQSWIARLHDTKRCKSEQLKLFLSSCGPFSVDDAETMFEVMSPRFQRFPSLVLNLMQASPTWTDQNALRLVELAKSKLQMQPVDEDNIDWSFIILDHAMQCFNKGSPFYSHALTLLHELASVENEVNMTSEAVRVQTLEMLARHDMHNAVERIVQFATFDSNQTIRIAAMKSLVENPLAGIHFMDDILNLMSDADSEIRRLAIRYAHQLILANPGKRTEVEQRLNSRQVKNDEDDDENRHIAKELYEDAARETEDRIAEILLKFSPSNLETTEDPDCF